MASFYIQTDKSHYQAGETIKGQVFVHLTTNINNTQGVTLRFLARQSLRWRQKRPIALETLVGSNSNLITTERNERNGNKEIYRTDELDISDCQSQVNGKDKLQPKIIKTAANTYFQVQYFEKRNQFALANAQLFPPGKITAGQYSFPFNLATNEEWPGSTNYKRDIIASQVRYFLTATLEPFNPRYHFRQRREVFISENTTSSGSQRFQEKVSSFYCLKKGKTQYEITFKKGSYFPGQQGQINISIDNSECSADVEGISLVFIHTLTQYMGDDPTKNVSELQKKEIQCLIRGGQSAKFSQAISIPFKVPVVPATSRGTFTFSDLSLKISLKHAATFYTNQVNILPITIGSTQKVREIPSEFKKAWKPTQMDSVTLKPSNLFKRADKSGVKVQG